MVASNEECLFFNVMPELSCPTPSLQRQRKQPNAHYREPNLHARQKRQPFSSPLDDFVKGSLLSNGDIRLYHIEILVFLPPIHGLDAFHRFWTLIDLVHVTQCTHSIHSLLTMPGQPFRKREHQNSDDGNHRNGDAQPHRDLSDFSQRLRQLNSERDPLSIPEQIAIESRRISKDSSTGEAMAHEPKRLSELQAMSIEQLLEYAKVFHIEDAAGLSKFELVFRILKEQIRTSGLMYGEGTLEILTDGIWFSSKFANALPILFR